MGGPTKTKNMLSALRVVLGVTEVSQVEALQNQINGTPRLMKAYHFQQTMKRFAQYCLDRVNANLAPGDIPQNLVNIDLLSLYKNEDWYINGEDHPVFGICGDMLFVRPDLDEECYILCKGSEGEGQFMFTDLDELANFFDECPETYDAIIDICFNDDRFYEKDTPDEGIVFVTVSN